VVQIHVDLTSRCLIFCRSRIHDLGIDNPSLWPTKLVLHHLGYENRYTSANHFAAACHLWRRFGRSAPIRWTRWSTFFVVGLLKWFRRAHGAPGSIWHSLLISANLPLVISSSLQLVISVSLEVRLIHWNWYLVLVLLCCHTVTTPISSWTHASRRWKAKLWFLIFGYWFKASIYTQILLITVNSRSQRHLHFILSRLACQNTTPQTNWYQREKCASLKSRPSKSHQKKLSWLRNSSHRHPWKIYGYKCSAPAWNQRINKCKVPTWASWQLSK